MSHSHEEMPPKKGSPRFLARLCAVECLYAMTQGGHTLEAALDDFKSSNYYLDLVGLTERKEAVDADFFEVVVKGVHEHQEQITDILKSVLTKGWSYERIDQVIRHVLEAATFELLYAPEIHVAVIADTYIEVVCAFFGQKEAGFANGVIHDIFKKVRS